VAVDTLLHKDNLAAVVTLPLSVNQVVNILQQPHQAAVTALPQVIHRAAAIHQAAAVNST
jgi:hypothetical protein